MRHRFGFFGSGSEHGSPQNRQSVRKLKGFVSDLIRFSCGLGDVGIDYSCVLLIWHCEVYADKQFLWKYIDTFSSRVRNRPSRLKVLANTIDRNLVGPPVIIRSSVHWQLKMHVFSSAML